MRYLVISIFLYACESWTPTAELQRRMRAMEKRCYREIQPISNKDHVTNEEVCTKQDPAGNRTTRRPPEHRKETQTEMVWTCLPFIGSGQNQRWEDSIKEWTYPEFAKSQRAVENREKKKILVVKSSVVSQRPPRLRDR